MKKRLFKLLKLFLFFILIIVVAGLVFTNSLQPTYEGSETITNLKTETTVYFDDYGIPHIYAENQEDAIRTLGYVHAQDRLWQMELLRRISPGRLAEIFGEVALPNDKLYAGLGIAEATEKTLLQIDTNSEVYKLSIAYLEGINEFIENGETPIEFYILGIDKQKFELKDTYNIIGYMAFSFAMGHKTDPVLSTIQAKLGNEYIRELGIESNPNSEFIQNFNQASSEISTAIASIMDASPVPPFIGSNSWVVSPHKTKSGKVLFANDPHIAYATPPVWYEAHIKTPDFESYGYYLGGVPFPLLAHNRDIAYGITMFENDDIDFYQEETHPSDHSKYKTANGYKTYESVKKTIKVKDAEDFTFDLKFTQHGPIMNGLLTHIDSEKPISISWIYTKKEDNQLLDALFQLSRAKNKSEFQKGLPLIHGPGLNLMYGDAKGNISWNAVGQLYKLPKEVDSKFILDGTNGKNEVVEYLGFSQNPQAHNPPWNYVASTNNQPDSIAGMLYPGYYLPEDRAKRVTQLLAPKNDFETADFMRMLNDSKSSIAPELVTIISKNIAGNLSSENQKTALDILNNWDGSFVKNSVAATIYTKFTYYYLKNTFEDEIGEVIFKDFINTHLMKRMIAEQLRKDNSIWWDNIHTPEKESRSNIISQSFIEAISTLEKQLGKDPNSWTWSRVHQLQHKHPLGSVKLLDFIFKFNIGIFETDGGNEVLNNQMYKLTNERTHTITGGPSTRRIVDFADIENSMSILPTGNSGNPFSKHYRDQSELYANGKFRKMKLNTEEIKKVSTKLIFTPKK